MSPVAVDRGSEVSAESGGENLRGWTPHYPAKMIRGVGAAVLIAILLKIFVGATYSNDETFVKSYNVWNVFHYYLGAKYYPEVGHFNLYVCALEADYESAGYWDRVAAARDMETYRVYSRSRLPRCPRGNFTPARWSEFTDDVECFARLAPPTYFSGLFIDKGFNPPPSWVAVARPIAQSIPISERRVGDVVFNLDVAALLAGLLIIWRHRSGFAALLTAGLATFYFGDFGCIGGNFLQHFWFPLMVLATLFWTKNRPGVSGAALGAAVGLQAFPLFFGLPIVCQGIFRMLRGRKNEEWRPHIKFTGGLIAVLLVSFLLGNSAGLGIGAWAEWHKKISIHRDYLQGEIIDVGLANLTADFVSENHNDGTSYVNEAQNTFMRLNSLRNNIWLYRALCATFLVMWALSVVCAPPKDLLGHGFLVMFAVVTVSPYYYLSLILLPLMFWDSGRVVRLYVIWGTVMLFSAHLAIFRGSSVSGQYFPHLLSGSLIALFLFGLAGVNVFFQEPPKPEKSVVYCEVSATTQNA